MLYRPIFLAILLITSHSENFAQYFYQDLLLSAETSEKLKKMKTTGIKTVHLQSFESDGSPTEGFKGQQSITKNYTQMVTELNSVINGSSTLTSYFNNEGLLIKTIDTTDGASSTTTYTYDENKRVVNITSIARSFRHDIDKEEHIWTYGLEGKPVRLLRIKNGTDTIFTSFILDEQKNVVEENSTRKGVNLPSYFYYYDDNNRLTDIVTYNQKANRLLPVYVFEYNKNGLLQSMLVVPEGSDDYQKWVYQYNEAGFKIKENCYNKKKRLLGRIEYRYQ